MFTICWMVLFTVIKILKALLEKTEQWIGKKL